jgi:hypothetical protein
VLGSFLYVRCQHVDQGSQAHRRVEILGPQAPFFGNFEGFFDRLIEILAQNEGVFRPVLPENPGSPPRNGSIGTPHRNWPMPINQLVEIPGGSLRALMLMWVLVTGSCAAQCCSNCSSMGQVFVNSRLLVGNLMVMRVGDSTHHQVFAPALTYITRVVG